MTVSDPNIASCPLCAGVGSIPWPRGMSPGFYSFVKPNWGPMVCPTCNGSGRHPNALSRPACPACGGPTVDRGAAVWCENCRTKVESCCNGGRTAP
jgi:DnaJ-class molecular chaperone